MARQGGRVQLERSDIRLALNMANMAKGGFSHTAIEEKHYLIKKPRAEVRQWKRRGVKFPGSKVVQAAMASHPKMVSQNHPDGGLPWQNGTSNNLLTRWRHKGTLAPQPIRRRQPTPEPTPALL